MAQIVRQTARATPKRTLESARVGHGDEATIRGSVRMTSLRRFQTFLFLACESEGTDVGLRCGEAGYSAIDRLAEPGELGPWNAFRNTATLDRVLAPAAEYG
jgi:hypothetical protein